MPTDRRASSGAAMRLALVRCSVARSRLSPDARREQILSVAITCFAEHGPSVSTTTIAERAGISVGLLFHYFPTKETLWLAAASKPGSFAQRVGSLLQASAGTSIESLIDAIADEVGRTERPEREVLAIMFGQALRGETLGEQIRSAHIHGLQALGAALVDKGLRPDLDRAQTVATGLLGGVILFFMMHHREDDARWAELAVPFTRRWLRELLVDDR